jgi:hypothetical protein
MEIPDLEDVFGDLADTLPSATEDEGFTFTKWNIPEPPLLLSTRSIWTRGTAFYFRNHFPIPAIEFCIEKRACQLLGLLILAELFHPDLEPVEVLFGHHPTRVERLRIRHEGDHLFPFYQTLPESFTYIPETVERYPLAGRPVRTLPIVSLTTADEYRPQYMPKWQLEVDTVVGFGAGTGAVTMADLLFNIALRDNQQDEFHLGGEARPGERGVGPASVEVAIWLPGSFGYAAEDNQVRPI